MSTYVRTVTGLTSVSAPTTTISTLASTGYSFNKVFSDWEKSKFESKWLAWINNICKTSNTVVKAHISNCAKLRNNCIRIDTVYCEPNRTKLKTLYNTTRTFTALSTLPVKTYTRHTKPSTGLTLTKQFSSITNTYPTGTGKIIPSGWAPLPSS